jgi:hypothetical protein
MNIALASQFIIGISFIKAIVPSTFQVKQNLGGPYFTTKFPSEVPVSLGSPLMLKLPQVSDPDPGDRPTVTVDWGFAADFI